MKPLFFSVCLLAYLSFLQTANYPHKSLISTWLKYDNPVNGYEIQLHCTQEKPQSSYFDTEIYLTKVGKTDTVRQTISFDNWEPWQLQGFTVKDTIAIKKHARITTYRLDKYPVF
ncbi:MAG: hypothetical protein IJT45_03560 [Bacteroidales bacterium]|nr:hypothetical protein [Bacteroidales bacterium]MBR0212149.1 hypothetical protein [Alphaproteobacteria bacterium]